ncbi:MAG: tetratricopeptide repeat protein [bacterium]
MDKPSLDVLDILDLLTALVEKSLAVYEGEAGAHGRYRLSESVRQYALDRLLESGEGGPFRQRQLAFFVELAEAAERELKGPDQARWLDTLQTEHDNLRASLEWSRGGDSELRLAAALARFWMIRGYLAEGREWLKTALAADTAAPPALRAKALTVAGHLAHIQGDLKIARGLYEQSLAIRRDLGDSRGLAASLHSLGIVAYAQSDYDTARTFYSEALAIFRDCNDRDGIAHILTSLGNVAFDQRDYETSASLYEEALEVNREIGNHALEAIVIHHLGLVAREQGERAVAKTLFKEALQLFRKLGDRSGFAECIEGLAGLAADSNARHAARLYGAAERLREEIGSPIVPNDRPSYERDVLCVRNTLDPQSFSVAWAFGRAMSLDEALALALAN